MELEFAHGLDNEDQATAKMLLTYVRSTPNHTESGTFLALDLGGTNFRTILITLPDRTWKSETHQIEERIMKGAGYQLFDFIAERLIKFVTAYAEEQRSKNKAWKHPARYPLGFTFSFPCYQHGLAVAKLVRWTKDFTCSGVEGQDVARLLREAIARYQLRPKEGAEYVPVDVVAVINDTTGTLMSCALDDSDCSVGLIVGTGCNSCFFESLDKIGKWTGNYEEPKQVGVVVVALISIISVARR